MGISVTAVPAQAALNRWTEVGPLLAATLPARLGRLLPEHILVMFIQGAAQAWFVLDGETLLAVAATRVENYPLKRVFTVFALGGTGMKDWFDQFDETLTTWAVQSGKCDQVEIPGRRGWEKILGFEPLAHFFVKDLTPETKHTAERKVEASM